MKAAKAVAEGLMESTGFLIVSGDVALRAPFCCTSESEAAERERTLTRDGESWSWEKGGEHRFPVLGLGAR